MSPITFLAALFVVTYLYIYLKAANQVRLKHGQAAYPQFEHRTPESMPAGVRRMFAREVPRLEELGFRLVAYLHKGDLRQNVDRRADSYVALLRNDETGDFAVAAEIAVQVKHVSNSRALVWFTAELPGGACLSTSNTPTLSVFKPDPIRRDHKFPNVNDVRFLYRIHRALVGRDAPGRKGSLPSPGMEVPHMCETEARTLMRQVECGYFYLDESRGMCMYTWKGALVMTGKLMYGVRDVRAALRDRRALKTLKSLGLKAA